MTRRQIRKARVAATAGAATATLEARPGSDSPLAAIFASIRDGEAPWSLDELPADTGATAVLLHELDRLWQNPVN